LRKLDERYCVVDHPVLVLAFFLDPLFISLRDSLNSQNVFPNDIPVLSKVKEAIRDLAPNNEVLLALGRELHLFIEKRTRDFDGISLEEAQLTHPLLFWTFTSSTPNLREVALRIFRMPCSASGGERNFKARNFIHSKLRVSLDKERVDQQSFVYYNSKVLDKDVMLLNRNGKFETILKDFQAGEELSALSSESSSATNSGSEVEDQDEMVIQVEPSVNLKNPEIGDVVRVWYDDKKKYFEGTIEVSLGGNDYQITWNDNRAKKNEVVTLEPDHFTRNENDKERWIILSYSS